MGDQSFMPAAQDPFISFCFNLFCSGMQFDLQIKKSDIISKGEMHQSSRCMQLAADRYAADSSYSARRCLRASASLRQFGRKTRLEVAGCRRALAGSCRVISECWQVMREARLHLEEFPQSRTCYVVVSPGCGKLEGETRDMYSFKFL